MPEHIVQALMFLKYLILIALNFIEANHSLIALYALCAFIGICTGLAELFSRYSWSFLDIFSDLSGISYLFLNAGSSCFCFWAARDLDLLEKVVPNDTWLALSTSFASMAFIRSAFINVKVGDSNLSAGLVSVLNIFLSRAERSLNYKSYQRLWRKVAPVTQSLDYETSRGYLTSATLLALYAALPTERDTFTKDAESIDKMSVENRIKLHFLSMRISLAVGFELLEQFKSFMDPKMIRENQLANENSKDLVDEIANGKKILRKWTN